MIEDPPLLIVRRRFERPSRELIAKVTGTPTGYIVDALDGRAALDAGIKPLPGTPASFCGPALTCDNGPADNLALFGAVATAEPGDVILAATDSFRATAVTGDLLLGMAKNRGVAAFVTDGMVRDQPGIVAVGLPCFCAGVTPNSPVRNGPGTIGQRIVIGGVAVESGDLVVGDGDGVVVVPRAAFATLLARLDGVRKAEAVMEAKVKAGLGVPDFIQDLFDKGRVKEIE
jgi:4-hydroxy-4-methyl-2-oxoglutarate aldolase